MIDLTLIHSRFIWYIVGYIVTDGCLSNDGRHIDITSKDSQILLNILKVLNLKTNVTRKHNSTGQCFYRIQFIKWLKRSSELYFGVIGRMYVYPRSRGRNELYLLKFGKIATRVLIKKCYYNRCLSLERKYKQAMSCLESSVGWNKYKFMKCPGAEIGIQSRLKIW